MGDTTQRARPRTPEQRARQVWLDLISIEPHGAVTGDVMIAFIAAAIQADREDAP